MTVAQELVQAKGYNAFSFHDIAQRLGIKSASIHYYFPAKSDLGKALMQHYRQDFINELTRIDLIANSTMEKLDKFTQLFLNPLQPNNNMCLCGMFASDIATMPEEISNEVRLFFNECEEWLTATLRAGQKSGEIMINNKPENTAQFIFAVMEGAMLSARTFADTERFKSITAEVIAALKIN